MGPPTSPIPTSQRASARTAASLHRGYRVLISSNGSSTKFSRPRTFHPPLVFELREVLEQLQEKDADDARAASAWKRVRELAPKAWAATEKVRDRLISEAIRRMIGG